MLLRHPALDRGAGLGPPFTLHVEALAVGASWALLVALDLATPGHGQRSQLVTRSSPWQPTCTSDSPPATVYICGQTRRLLTLTTTRMASLAESHSGAARAKPGGPGPSCRIPGCSVCALCSRYRWAIALPSSCIASRDTTATKARAESSENGGIVISYGLSPDCGVRVSTLTRAAIGGLFHFGEPAQPSPAFNHAGMDTLSG